MDRIQDSRTSHEAHLLVVDDEPNIRDLLASSLRFAGFEVTTAADGNGALHGVDEAEPDLIVLAGFMKLLGAPFTDRFGDRIINSHPALLPAFPGAHAVRDALAAGATGTGCSIFWVDEGVDTGRMIAQVPVEILPGDDEPTLHERIKVSERTLLVKTVNELAAQHATGPRPAARKVMP